ncbi:MAG: glycosyltransferase [Candidatus Omnitrophota bacterium]|nr:glycosyltransferase [Candidatus Omnitrophota bacterium]
MISTLIATYNRGPDLRLVLGCLLNQRLPAGLEHEVIIIDNNSNDDTRAVVESLIPSFGGKLKYFFEPRQGKSFAINKGIQEAQGEIIVLTDDDCTFESDYIAKIYQAFQKGGLEIGFIGGRILPRYVGCSKPAWFAELEPGWWYKEFFWGPLAVLDYGEEPFIIDKRGLPLSDLKLFYGANMAVRKELFFHHGHFDIEKYHTHDTEFQLRFLREGARGLYTPEVKVYHKITADRLTPQYYYRWYFKRGYLLDFQGRYREKIYHPFGIQWAMLAKTVKLLVTSVFVRSLTQKVYRRCQALFNLGQMKQLIKENS